MKYFLSSKRLGFRKWTYDDFHYAKKLWGSYEVSKFIEAKGKLSDKQISERLKKEIETEKTYGLQYWPLFLLSNEEHIGCCGLRPFDMTKMIYEIGAHILPVHWRKGFAVEALQTVMEYAFIDLKAAALFAGHNPMHDASSGLMQKLHFQYTHDEYYPPTGLNHPSYLQTADEYFRLKKV
jgi:RimJ/RimL family protein N-acetyltransferase